MLGNRVELLATLERRLELLAEAGVEETLVVEFTPELAAARARGVRRARTCAAIGAEVVVAGEDFRFGRGRSGDLELLERLGFDVRAGAARRGRLVDARSASSLREGDVAGAARAARPPARGRGHRRRRGRSAAARSAFRPRTSRVDPSLLVPAYGIYAGAALGHRAAISIGVNPHYGGDERRIEAFLLDFEGDLYGQRLVVELWQRLRDERAFESEEELVEQIARDVEATAATAEPTHRASGRDEPRREVVRTAVPAISARMAARRPERSASACSGRDASAAWTCGAAYAKPTGGRNRASANPGCPECGYLGWLRPRSRSARTRCAAPLRRGSPRRARPP